MCFFNSSEQAFLEQAKFISSMKHIIYRKYSIHKLTEFSQGNNVLDTTAYNTHGFSARDTWLFITAEVPYLKPRELVSTLNHQSCRKYSFQKLTRFSQGSSVLDAAPSITDGCLYKILEFLQFSWTGLFGAKGAFPIFNTMTCRTYSFKN
jgi:hypothetical protein